MASLTASADQANLADIRTDKTSLAIDDAIARPGAVRIIVQGAFIVDDDALTPETTGDDGSVHDNRVIRLPHHTAMVSHIAIDIGGSLAKLVYFSREPNSNILGGQLNFLKFEIDMVDQCLEFMKELKKKQRQFDGSPCGELCVVATGGGAYKYYERMKKVLGIEILQEDEMECLIIGHDFFITEIPREVFTYIDFDPITFAEPRADIYPYLLVNIGSGVSMIKVAGPKNYERVGGTHLGGGTLWGLLSLLTGARTFDEMLAMADKGDNAGVDMMVGDIYGADYGKIGLKSTTIASSFGKVFKMKRQAEHDSEDDGGILNRDRAQMNGTEEASRTFRPEDISKSLLFAISNNIGQIAYLQSEKYALEDIYFAGSFIRGHRQTMNTLSYAIKYWSNGKKKAYFLRHEGYLGAVGAFLKRQPRNWGRRYSMEDTRP